MNLWATMLALVGVGCGFRETLTPAGIPNLAEISPGLWRMGQPPTLAAWVELEAKLGHGALIVKLNDEAEGSDDTATIAGFSVVRIPLPPEDDRPWSVFEMPAPGDVARIVATITQAHAAGTIVAWHCTHGRDRTSLVAALVGMRLLGWTKDAAWQDMLDHGFRWELPDLDAYWLEDVQQ